MHLLLNRRQKAWNIFCLERILTRDERHVIVTSVICLKVERNRLVLLHQPSTSVSVSSHSQCLKLQKILNYSWQWNLASWAHTALHPGASVVSMCAAWELHPSLKKETPWRGLRSSCAAPYSKSLHLGLHHLKQVVSTTHISCNFLLSLPIPLYIFPPSLFLPHSFASLDLPSVVLHSAHPRSRQGQKPHSCLVYQSQLHNLQHLPQLRQPHEWAGRTCLLASETTATRANGHCINKPQNHRTISFGRDLKDHLVPTTLFQCLTTLTVSIFFP